MTFMLALLARNLARISARAGGRIVSIFRAGLHAVLRAENEGKKRC
jgi:hypothetical protein